MLKKFILMLLLAAATSVFADESMRVNMKSAIAKGCMAGAGNDVSLKELSAEEYCDCSADGFIDGLTDGELKQMFIGGDKALMQAKMQSAAASCLAKNSGSAAFVKSAVYKGCLEKTSAENGFMNKKAYCTCISDKISVSMNAEDMQDAIAIGQGSSKMIDTKVADKVMSVAAECLNQTIKQ